MVNRTDDQPFAYFPLAVRWRHSEYRLESSKVIRLFDALKIINIKQRGLSNILKSYVIPAVFQVWDREQKSNIATIKGKPVTIASDMRVDSPGHSGLLGSGSTLDLESKLVLDTQVIKVNIGL